MSVKTSNYILSLDLPQFVIDNQIAKQNLLISFLSSKHPDVYSKIEQLLDITNFDRLQIIGEMMSGKTDAMIAVHHIDLVFHLNFCIHIVPESGDIPQFELSIANYNKEWNLFAEQTGQSLFAIDIKLNFASKLKLDSEKQIIDDLSVSDSCMYNMLDQGDIIVVLGHHDQLYRQTKLLCDIQKSDHQNFRNYSIIFDESHVTMYPGVSKAEDTVDSDDSFIHMKDPFDTTRWPATMSTHNVVTHVLCSMANRITGCSATACMNMIDDESELGCIIHIKPNMELNYKSVCDQEYIRIEEMVSSAEDEDGQYSIHKDESLQETIGEWSTQDPLDRKSYGLKQTHPVFALIQVSRFVDIHEEINEYIWDEYADAFVTIIQNNKGIQVTFPNNVAEYIKTRRQSKVVVNNLGEIIEAQIDSVNQVLFKNTPLHCVLQYLSDLKKRVQRIVLIAGACVRQGRRINSTDYKIGLTDEFIRDETSCLDTACQKLRIVGYRPDKRYTKVHCTEQFQKQVVNSYMLNQELIQKVLSCLTPKDRKLTAQTVIKQTKISTSKIPNRKLCKKHGINTLQKTNKPIDELFKDLSSYL
jgi:L-rhamnose mutarotase